MRISVSTIVFLVSVVMLSIFVANVANLIATDSKTHHEEETQRFGREKPRIYKIGDKMDNLMWFLQISDIHISIFKDPFRITELKEFCDKTVDAFNPPVVIASGDLTDAKKKDAMGSKQSLDEWKHYKRVLDESGVLKKTTWLDVRGNHDNFNVINMKSPENYYLNYSVQGRRHPRSYLHQLVQNSQTYSFIAVDACLEPGPKRPFNFVGFLDEYEIDKIKELVQESKRLNSDYIVWFGHYPTSCILSQCNNGIREIMAEHKEGMVYLCGHYHTLGGLVPEMYTLQRGGYLELELADWKDNRMYRVGIIDHGQFSFSDNQHNNWPVAVITNPKHVLFTMPERENIKSIVESTHVRVLAFSTVPIKSVSIRINEEGWVQCRKVEGPLYVTRWNASRYLNGIHTIRTKVVDELNREKEVVQMFALDGSRMSFKVLGKFLLMSDASRIFAIAFGVMLVLNVIPLCVLRVCHKLVLMKKMQRPRLRIRCFHIFVRKVWITSTINYLFWPMVLYPLYLVFGPWAAGEVIEDSFGVIFAWGMYIGNSYLPGSFTYAYGFFQLFTFHVPLTIILAFTVDRRFQMLENPLMKPPNLLVLLWRQLPFFLLISMQTVLAYFFWLAYGTVATILCPFRSWSILIAIVLWYLAHTVPNYRLRSAVSVWSSAKRLSIDD
ncbi:transmembrane protein 62-like [Diachasmimorpha longicaudata]|uniref:transmembrane protein 62-like n=1 Tax=Diachasmimorpha longicaudata TaxID=58733 RepID=UPI0030B874CE